MRINLARRAVENRLGDGCGSERCDSRAVKVLSLLQGIRAGGSQNTEQILTTVEREVNLGSVDMPKNSHGAVFSYESQLCFFFNCKLLFFSYIFSYNFATVLYEEFKTGLIKSAQKLIIISV